VKTREIRERDVTGRFKLDRNGNPLVHTEEISRTRVKVERITGLANNLALALAAPSVRIEAPVPGKNVVGIEVPNLTASMVSLRSVIETPTYQRLRSRAKLALALGQGVAGDVVVADLAKMPHLLIAGATGSGKSVCINTVICSIIMHASPDEVRFMMVDPKRVEMMPYSNIPHLLCPVIVEPERVVGTLQFVIREMEERYRKFAAIGVRNIEGFNKSPRAAEHMPYWVIIIDELADLMMVAPFEVEKSLCRLAQLARATGIHLVVATQRPSVDVITGLIKANFPTRISFAVSSQIDSRTILDAGGAEKLLGRGDMLYVPTDATKPKRVQGAYVSDTEVERIGMYWADDRFRDLRPKQFAEEVEQAIAAASGEGETDDDPLLDRARELAASSERVSTSFLQRRLRIGYPRASRLMEALRDEGYGDDSDDEGAY
jgi:S-DNA-T family DNA segregation ATPase FtsK/SpoIIIE